MSAPGPGGVSRVRLALVGVILLAATMRGPMTTVSPIAGPISADLGLDAASLTIIGMLPTLAFAVFGLLSSALTGRVGLQPAVVLSLVLMTGGHVGRAVASDLPSFILSSAVLLSGIGIANVLLPPLIKLYFPGRIALTTAVAAGVMSIGTALPAVAVYPMAELLGWRGALGAWALLALAALPPWLLLAVRPDPALRPGPVVAAPAARSMTRSPTAWLLLVIYTTMAVNLYAIYIWLPALVDEAGRVGPAAAGALLGLFSIMGLVASILTGIIAPRLRSPAVLVPYAIAFLLAGYAGMIAIPELAPLWVILFGLCPPTLFQVSFMLIGLMTRDERTAVSLSAFVQGLGFGVGALGPLAFGALRAGTGSWTVPLVVFGVLSLGAAVVALRLRPGRYVEDELRR